MKVMKSIVSIFLTTFLFGLSLSAQTSHVDWAYRIGGESVISSTKGINLTIDEQGNTFVIGCFFGTVNFDPHGMHEIESKSGWNNFVAKYNDSGSLLWALSLGKTDNERGTIAIDKEGNIVVSVYYEYSINHNPFGLTGTGMVLAKFDVSGAILWAYLLDNNIKIDGNSTTFDKHGNINISGYFTDTANFGTNATHVLTSNGNRDIFIAKYNATGALLWVNGIGGDGFDMGYSIAVDKNDNVLVLGSFSETVNFDPHGIYNLTSNGSVDIFMAKYNDTGALVWAHSIGSSKGDWGYSIATDTDGNVFIIGSIQDTINIDPYGTHYLSVSDGTWDYFLAKYNDTGSLLWAHQYKGNHSIINLSTDQEGNIYLGGGLNGTINLDQNSTQSLSGYGVFAAKYNRDGSIQWANKFKDCNIGNSIAVDRNYNVLITGSFAGKAIFDPTKEFELESKGRSDMYLLKLNCNLNTTHSISACDSFTWIDGKTYFTNNNTATSSITNEKGCENLFSLNLTIKPSSTSIDEQTACDSFTWINGITYYSNNNTANYKMNNSEGCDSMVTLNLIINISPQPIITQNGHILRTDSFTSYQWYFNGFIIPTANNQTFNANQEGKYTVAVIDSNGCMGTSQEYIFSKAGTSSLAANAINIYPNPSQGTIHIEVDGYFEYSVYDIQGKMILKGSSTNHTELHYLLSGLYLIRLQTNNYITTTKVLISP